MKKIGLVILGIGVLIGSIYLLTKQDNSKILIKEQVKQENTSLVFMLQDKEGNYNKSEELPSSGYSLNTSKSVCSNNTIPTWEDNKLYLNNLSKNGTSCYLYFDTIKKVNTILGEIEVNIGEPDFSQVATTDEGIYEAEDDWGESYYFRGAVENNWLKFAGYYWRIIRINGDGSIRMIYQGTNANTTGTEPQLQTSAFNLSYNLSEYVGYMYTSGQVHGLETSSTVKELLDTWYSSNLVSYADKISAEAGFCGDREPSTSSSISNGQGGTGTTQTYYGGYIRLITNKSPDLKCENSSDLYTVSGSSKGNKALTNLIGLITADEVAMAGGVYGTTNESYYLYTGQTYWTMSPCNFPNADVFFVSSNGNLRWDYVADTIGIRPVINLASDVILSGTGTASDPYIVEGAE